MSDNRSYLIDRINGTEGDVFYHLFLEASHDGQFRITSGSEVFGSHAGFWAQVFYENGAVGVFSDKGKIMISSRKEDYNIELDRAEVVAEFKRWKQSPEVRCKTDRLTGDVRGIKKTYYLCGNSYLPD